MNKYILALLIVCITSAIHAADYYKKGWDKDFVAGCSNPTAREDGTLLDPVNNPNDVVTHITYYVDPLPDNTTTPYYSFKMPGGCQDMTVDLTQFPTGDWFRYATATLADGMTSDVSLPNPFRYASRPDTPGNVR